MRGDIMKNLTWADIEKFIGQMPDEQKNKDVVVYFHDPNFEYDYADSMSVVKTNETGEYPSIEVMI